jgi:hypothetical protein
MKKYRLLRTFNIPGTTFKPGTIIDQNSVGDYGVGGLRFFDKKTVENTPSWFEEINEPTTVRGNFLWNGTTPIWTPDVNGKIELEMGQKIDVESNSFNNSILRQFAKKAGLIEYGKNDWRSKDGNPYFIY